MFRYLFFTLVFLGLILGAAPASSQIPDEFTNLKLLDPEIEKRQLVSIMKDWASGLGVRCTHCHVGPDNLQGMDFATDEKATKRTARKMLLMSRAINRELLVGLPVVEESERKRAQVVSCYTCHRGLSTPPRRVGFELTSVALESGAEEAVSRYRELVGAHGNAGQYDLRLSVLISLDSSHLVHHDTEGARTILANVLETDPELASGYAMLARLELSSENLEASEAAVAKALSIDPEDWIAIWVQDEIRKARVVPEPEEKVDEPDS